MDIVHQCRHVLGGSMCFLHHPMKQNKNIRAQKCYFLFWAMLQTVRY